MEAVVVVAKEKASVVSDLEIAVIAMNSDGRMRVVGVIVIVVKGNDGMTRRRDGNSYGVGQARNCTLNKGEWISPPPNYQLVVKWH
jgi:hypothetical protein